MLLRVSCIILDCQFALVEQIAFYHIGVVEQVRRVGSRANGNGFLREFLVSSSLISSGLRNLAFRMCHFLE